VEPVVRSAHHGSFMLGEGPVCRPEHGEWGEAAIPLA
jgi:hypothetical protein